MITSEEYKCFENVDNITIDGSILEKQDEVRFSETDNGIVSISETAPFSLRKLRYHLQLYDTYKTPTSTNPTASALSTTDKELLGIPKTFKINPRDLNFRSGGYAFQHNLQRAKATPEGQEVQAAEEVLSQYSLKTATTLEGAIVAYNAYQEHKHTLRKSYYSPALNRSKKRYEMRQEKAHDRTCSAERKYSQQQQQRQALHIMFVGDRGYGVGSSIRGHVRLGGSWKPKKHSLCTSVCITNEHNTSQVCVFCFKKISHPLRIVKKDGIESLKTINGTSICNNKACVLNSAKQSHKPRDSLSALAIGISGASRLIGKGTLDVFNPYL
ncbi:hypothetical protein EDC96DRAFT_463609 [Choanephora cucurbitarum]|nr:hypothetical protein EDC96DRAFT_463609 [Choanephora cucurbitarum]